MKEKGAKSALILADRTGIAITVIFEVSLSCGFRQTNAYGR